MLHASSAAGGAHRDIASTSDGQYATPHSEPQASAGSTPIHIRRHHADRYTVMPNRIVQDDLALSARALGVLTYLLSLKDGWCTSAERVAARFKEGRGAIRTALAEIEAAGYLRRVRRQDERGRWSTTWHLTDDPHHWEQDLEPDHEQRTAPEPPAHTAPTGTDDRFLAVGVTSDDAALPQVKPTTGNRSSVSRSSVSRSSYKEPHKKNLPFPRRSAADNQDGQKGREGKPSSKTTSKTAPARPDVDRRILDTILAGVPTRYRGSVAAARRRWWPAAQAALDVGWTAADLAQHLAVPWPVDSRSPVGLVASRLWDAANEPPPGDATPGPRAVEHCGQCSPVRRLEDEDGNDLGPCPRCNPIYWSAAGVVA